jgi:DNA-directed RNA polymerase specialized sigma24 family protein
LVITTLDISGFDNDLGLSSLENVMKISMARMITDLVAKGRALGSRYAWWSRWFPAATTVDADRFQSEAEPYPDHWREFPHRWPDGAALKPQQAEAALGALPRSWRRVVIMRDVDGHTPAEVTAATGLTADQQRDVLNRARESIREAVGHALEQDRDAS